MENSTTLRSILVGLSLLVIAIVPVQGVTAVTGVLAGQRIKICLDPGHGGSDPGAVNETYGLEEAEINLDVATALKGLLEGAGFEVVMTRTISETYLTNSDRYTFCNNEEDPAADILVSVHTNSTLKTWMNGSMALYFHDDDKALAWAIHQVVYESLKATDHYTDTANFIDFGLSHFASGVLMRSDMPAAIMEPLCMSYEGEAELLVQPITDPINPQTGPMNFDCRRGEIAQAIYQGVLNYDFSSPEPPPEPGCRGRDCR